MKSKEQKRREAISRNSNWNLMTPEQQIAALDRRLGVNIGAARQRKRLLEAASPVEEPKETRKERKRKRKKK